MTDYEAVIGLEVHAQLLTGSKIFSPAPARADTDAKPNTNVSPVCLGMPGALPVLNAKAVELAVTAAVATNCSVEPVSRFERKNYFYPDLPKGYQISQYQEPLARGGWIDIGADGEEKKIRITRIHMEEDAGKLIHSGTASLVDLNRAGVALIEIVSEPDMREPDEAARYVRLLRQILRYANVCDGNMEKGNLRCDANISLRPAGCQRLGVKVEIKNLNSFKFIKKALEYETARQAAALRGGEVVVQETRLFDPDSGKTFAMRSKEEADDYRYFPDPDLPPLVVETETVESAKQSLPEMPAEKMRRFVEEYEIKAEDAERLTAERGFADYFEAAAKKSGAPKETANWILTNVAGREDGGGDFAVSAENLGEMVAMIKRGEISNVVAKEKVFPQMAETGKTAAEIVKEAGLSQVSDAGEIGKIAREFVEKHPKEAERFRGGEEKLMGFFVGGVMKETGGKVNPKVAGEELKKILGGEK